MRALPNSWNKSALAVSNGLVVERIARLEVWFVNGGLCLRSSESFDGQLMTSALVQ
jgi:hypothetical protein